METTNALGLSSDRVESVPNIELDDVECSSICEQILWKPVSCANCETHFCSLCIQKWLATHPNQCPMRCTSFVERPCSKFIARQLAKLKVKCIYENNGCKEIVPYEALEKHEDNCDFKTVQCPYCSQSLAQKNLSNHCTKCTSNPSSMDNYTSASTTFRETNSQLEADITRTLILNGLIPDRTPGRIVRQKLPSTEAMDSLKLNRLINDRAEIQTILCCVCNEVVWKPTSCKKCQAIFCYKCSPWTGAIKSILSFFGNKTPHGTRNCTDFEATSLPDAVDRVLVRTKYRCCYSSNGCLQECYYKDINEHESRCEFEAVFCSVCQDPISERRGDSNHTMQDCFKYLHTRNPSAIQQQLMFLLNETEKTKKENSALRTAVDKISFDLKRLEEQFKKTEAEKNPNKSKEGQKSN